MSPTSYQTAPPRVAPVTLPLRPRCLTGRGGAGRTPTPFGAAGESGRVPTRGAARGKDRDASGPRGLATRLMERDAEHHGDDDRLVDDDGDMEPVSDDPEVPEADAIEQATPAPVEDEER